MTRTAVADAIRQGAEAARQGARPNTCPYGRADILRTAWVKGYVRGKREQAHAAPQ